MKTHSKVEIEKTFSDIECDEFTFKAKKLNSLTLQTESFKLMKTLGTALGTSADARAVGMAWSAMAEAIYENFTEEHFVKIRDLLLKEVFYKNDDQEWIKCSEDFWDENDYLLEVTFWLIKENFVNFIQRSSMFQHLLNKMGVNLVDVKEELEKKLKELMNSEF